MKGFSISKKFIAFVTTAAQDYYQQQLWNEQRILFRKNIKK